MTDNARYKSTIYVGGLGAQVTRASLQDAFLPFGDIADITFPMSSSGLTRSHEADALKTSIPQTDAGVSRHRGFAYIEYENVDDAKEAIDNMDKAEFFGKAIKVTAAKAPSRAAENLGSQKALWQQESWISENAAREQNGVASEQRKSIAEASPDLMQGVEGLDVDLSYGVALK